MASRRATIQGTQKPFRKTVKHFFDDVADGLSHAAILNMVWYFVSRRIVQRMGQSPDAIVPDWPFFIVAGSLPVIGLGYQLLRRRYPNTLNSYAWSPFICCLSTIASTSNTMVFIRSLAVKQSNLAEVKTSLGIILPIALILGLLRLFKMDDVSLRPIIKPWTGAIVADRTSRDLSMPDGSKLHGGISASKQLNSGYKIQTNPIFTAETTRSITEASSKAEPVRQSSLTKLLQKNKRKRDERVPGMQSRLSKMQTEIKNHVRFKKLAPATEWAIQNLEGCIAGGKQPWKLLPLRPIKKMLDALLVGTWANAPLQAINRLNYSHENTAKTIGARSVHALKNIVEASMTGTKAIQITSLFISLVEESFHQTYSKNIVHGVCGVAFMLGLWARLDTLCFKEKFKRVPLFGLEFATHTVGLSLLFLTLANAVSFYHGGNSKMLAVGPKIFFFTLAFAVVFAMLITRGVINTRLYIKSFRETVARTQPSITLTCNPMMARQARVFRQRAGTDPLNAHTINPMITASEKLKAIKEAEDLNRWTIEVAQQNTQRISSAIHPSALTSLSTFKHNKPQKVSFQPTITGKPEADAHDNESQLSLFFNQ